MCDKQEVGFDFKRFQYRNYILKKIFVFPLKSIFKMFIRSFLQAFEYYIVLVALFSF